MDNRILIRSSLSKWPSYLTGFLGICLIITGAVLGAVNPAIWLAFTAGLMGLLLIFIAMYMEVNRIKKLMWVTLEPGRFTVIDNVGERPFNDDDVVSVALQYKDNFDNGRHTSTSRTFRVWVVAQGDRPELIEMLGKFKIGEADPLKSFIERIVKLLKTRADDDRQKNQSILGEGWELTNKQLLLRHPKTGESETLLSEIAAIMDVEGKLKIWKQGEDEAFAQYPLDAANAHILQLLLQEELAKRPEDNKEPPAGQLGRVIFERKPRKSLIYLLLALGLLLLFLGIVMFASVSMGVQKKNDTQALIIVGIGLLCIGAGLCFYTLTLLKALFRCHEYGVYQRSFFGEKKLLYSEVEAFTYSATRHYHNGAYVGTNLKLSFLPMPNLGKPKLVYSTSVKNVDNSLDQMRDEIAGMIAGRLYREVQAGTPTKWTDALVLEPQQLRYTVPAMFGKNPPQTIPYQQITGHTVDQGTLSLFQRGKPKPFMTESISAKNFFPGYFALMALLQQAKQSPAAPATAAPLAEDSPA